MKYLENASDSHITTQITADGPSEVQITRQSEEGLICNHTTDCTWEHLEKVVSVAQKELADAFIKRNAGIQIAFEPINLTVSFWRKKWSKEQLAAARAANAEMNPDEITMMSKRNAKLMHVHETHVEETLERLLEKLPRLLQQQRRAFGTRKSVHLMIALEWRVVHDSKPASKVAEIIGKVIAANS